MFRAANEVILRLFLCLTPTWIRYTCMDVCSSVQSLVSMKGIHTFLHSRAPNKVRLDGLNCGRSRYSFWQCLPVCCKAAANDYLCYLLIHWQCNFSKASSFSHWEARTSKIEVFLLDKQSVLQSTHLPIVSWSLMEQQRGFWMFSCVFKSAVNVLRYSYIAPEEKGEMRTSEAWFLSHFSPPD